MKCVDCQRSKEGTKVVNQKTGKYEFVCYDCLFDE